MMFTKQIHIQCVSQHISYRYVKCDGIEFEPMYLKLTDHDHLLKQKTY